MSDEVVNSFLGRQLGPCELLDVVGSGTYGTVFRARDTTQANVWRAVKVLVGPVADVTAFKFRLPQEIRRAITLSHPHVVPVYRFGSEEGLQYVVMEFVESVSLAGLLRQAPVETRHADPTIHQCLRQVAAALDYAHAQRVVHADVNPANILLRRPDRHALVTDFCIGRAVPLDRLAELGIAFDCAYRSPEQCAPSPSDLTAAADVYALAAVLWHVVTGAPPFGTGMEARARHVSEPLPELSRAGAQLPSGLQEVLARGLAKPPGDRHQRASQLVREFISAAAGRAPVPTRPQPPAPAPAPVVAPPVPVAPAPVPSGPAISAPPAPPPAERPVYVFDPTRELRESPLWRPHPSAAAAEPPQPAWRLPLWLI